MTNLKNEYIDAKDVKHKVEHIIMPTYDKNSKERVIEELFSVLTRPDKHISV